MRTLVVLAALLSFALPAGAQVEAFRYQPEKVTVGKVYHYVKTNLDGTHPEQISIRVADKDRIESFKFHPGSPPAALVTAKMDWPTFSASRLESLQVFGDGTRKLAATLQTQEGGKVRVEIPLLGTPAETVEIPRTPWHIYNFDLASLNFAFRHLVDPKGRFTVGIADPMFRQEGPSFVYKGEVEVAYAGEEARGGVPCRKYRIDGKGLENRGGFFWVDAAEGHFVDVEIDLPDNPDWKTFKFQLQKVEEMDVPAWERFMKDQLAAR